MNQIPTERLLSASKRILDKIAKNKKHIVEFINTETNKDNYFCELILRKTAKASKLKLVLYTGILDYAAFEEIWVFNPKRHNTTAIKIFNQLRNALEEIRDEYNQSMMPSANIMPMIRNKIQDIGHKFKQKTHILSLDTSKVHQLSSDWRQNIYGVKYPNSQDTEKEKITKFHGNQIDTPTIRKTYLPRETI